MKIHRAGHRILLLTGCVLITLNIIVRMIVRQRSRVRLFRMMSTSLFGLMFYFFRVPRRFSTAFSDDEHIMLAPAHGTVVAVQPVAESQFLNQPCVRISIYLSLFNMHLSTAPITGQVIACDYATGTHRLAFDPGASVTNERQTIVMATADDSRVRVDLIAGSVARRICCYVTPGQHVQRGGEIGFIRFGSRVDVILPPEWEVLVHVGQRLQLATTPIARRH